MMPMTRQQVEILLDTPARSDYVVSAYIDMTVQDGFQRHLELALKNEARSAAPALAEAEARKDLDANIAVIREVLQNESYPTARGLAVFSSVARGLRQVIPLEFPVDDRLVIDEEPFLLPILERCHAEPSFLIAHFNSNEAHLLERYHGRPEPARDMEREDADDDIQRDKPRFTNKKRLAATHHERLQGAEDTPFFRELAGAIAERWKEGDFAGLILLAPQQDSAAVRKLLPREIEAHVIGEAPHALTASVNALNDVVCRLVDPWEAERRRRILAEMEERRKQGHLLAQGPTEVLDALQQGRAAQLLFSAGRELPGARCSACGYRFGAPVGVCPYCQGRCESRDAAQDILRMATKHRVPVHVFREPAKEDPLATAGGVAALLHADENWTKREAVYPETKTHAPVG
jgi:peptide subunit release factor 1 (eRF1)